MFDDHSFMLGYSSETKYMLCFSEYYRVQNVLVHV